MTTWVLLAPGPSARAEDAQALRQYPLGAVGCAYQLAPWAAFVASSDAAWWRSYPDVYQLGAKRYCMGSSVKEAEKIELPQLGAVVNSGVLALECAKRAGATRILLLGFDMHGTHFFGPYTNGLRNAQPNQRSNHMKQYEHWAKVNRKFEVLNLTKGSALTCFPKGELDACVAELTAPRQRAG